MIDLQKCYVFDYVFCIFDVKMDKYDDVLEVVDGCLLFKILLFDIEVFFLVIICYGVVSEDVKCLVLVIKEVNVEQFILEIVDVEEEKEEVEQQGFKIDVEGNILIIDQNQVKILFDE